MDGGRPEHPAGAGCGTLRPDRISLGAFWESGSDRSAIAMGGSRSLVDDILFPVSVSLKEIMKGEAQHA